MRLRHALLTVGLLTLVAPSLSRAEERRAHPLAPGDWLEADRKRFQALSTRLSGPELTNAMPAVLTFPNAALRNTREEKPREYRSVEQRNAYYNLISLVIEFDRNTPAPVKDVKFFHAATLVTLWTQVGAIDAVDDVFCVRMSADTRAFLRDANQRLFDANLKVVNRLLFEWKEPRDPRAASPTAPISTWAFDAAMVRMEQDLVEDVIRERNPSAAVRQEINSLDSCVLSYLGNLAVRGGDTERWVADAVGRPDFFKLEHRRAIGYAMITGLHRRTKADFESLLRAD
ncbi:hypothetical protein [Phenylobacterium sp.]|uniref:hypothetical protein n=1 Tax=Phenylobacterium sp. TaxID=1871053 RepID=UPI002FE3340D